MEEVPSRLPFPPLPLVLCDYSKQATNNTKYQAFYHLECHIACPEAQQGKTEGKQKTVLKECNSSETAGQMQLADNTPCFTYAQKGAWEDQATHFVLLD